MRNVLHKVRSSLLTLITASLMWADMVYADPNELLGNAIKNAARLEQGLPTKERLATYETVFDLLDKIVTEYPSSDQAINILTNQSIGSFDHTRLRTTYVEELSEYYDTVCEASPSYSCLGFVSLRDGNEQCRNASSFNEVSKAHASIKNAADVFIGQRENNSYISLAMSSYRNCLDQSKFETNTFASDFFKSELLDTLLDYDQAGLVRAEIENMNTPYFKFLGALKLSKYQKKSFDTAYFTRMRRYIDESITDEEYDKPMSNYALLFDALQRSDFVLDYDTISSALETYGDPNRMMARLSSKWEHNELLESYSCDHIKARSLVEILTTLQTEILHGYNRESEFRNQELGMLMKLTAEHAWEPLTRCESEGFRNYYILTYIHGQLLLDNVEVAADFRNRALSESLSITDQLRYYFDHFGQTKTKFEQLNEYEREYSPSAPMFSGAELLDRADARYFVFEKMVDFGEVCEASRILFQELKEGAEFEFAVEYMINSPNISSSVKYTCGDEDLELLLD